MRIEHIAIWAKDIEKLKDFYITYFDARSDSKYTNEKNNFSSYFLKFESGARLELMQMTSIPLTKDNAEIQFTGYIHLAISTGSKERVNSLTKELKADGYRILDGPRNTGDGYYESTVLDPEENRIEITE